MKNFITIIPACLLTLQVIAQKNFEFHIIDIGLKQQIPGNFEEVKDNNLRIGAITCLYETKDQLIWIGTEQNGLLAYNGANMKHFRYDPNNPLSLPSDYIIDTWEETPDILWVSTMNGIAKLNRLTGKFIRFSPDSKNVAKGKDGKLYTASPDLHIIDTAKKKTAASKRAGSFS